MPMTMSTTGRLALWRGENASVAVRPATIAIPASTDMTKLPATYPVSNANARGRLRMTRTAAIAVGLVMAARMASGIR